MPNFMMVYKGEATDMSEMTPEQGAEVMAKWGAWIGKVGEALVDVGSPFGTGKSVVDDGSQGPAAKLSGYSIVAADDLETAVKLSDGHPYLSEGKGDYSIEVFELLPVPFE